MKKTNSFDLCRAQYGPMTRKSFSSSLDRFLATECPQMGGPLTRQALLKRIQEIVDQFYPPLRHLRMGQVIWPAVAEGETHGYGKPIEKTLLKPVVLDLVTPDDVTALADGECIKDRRKTVAIRLFQQAKLQGGVLTETDVVALLYGARSWVSNTILNWEKAHSTIVPRRGTVHDIGRSVTHKREICRKVLREGKSIEQTCRETHHSPDAVTRYVKDYKRILTCLRAGLSPQQTSLATDLSPSLVAEYKNLIEQGSTSPTQRKESHA